ncbi:MAG: putative zinc-binding peptidase [Acetobacteraceae bacterium]|nr:putative zinc-binding peptidase [Acetobacteraceae bacterium]
MRLFRCQVCGQVLHFENTRCERCGSNLGFLPGSATLSALERDGRAWRALAQPEGRFRFCANAGPEACNWLIPARSPESLCQSCRHNRVIPDLGVPENQLPWRRWEMAKHRLVYTLLRLRLPMPTRAQDPEGGLAFDILADAEGSPQVMTGHDNGLITLALAEAEDAERERRRVAMGEPYRTLLGHVRHETGHFYWDRLVRLGGKLEAFRRRFGDERQDYAMALQRHHAEGPPAAWQERFVSAYATAHPWEDFAESWAHYLHMLDTLEMAAALEFSVQPRADTTGVLRAEIVFDPYAEQDFTALVDAWVPLTHAVNSLNRCMGAPDIYPFVLAPPVIEKLAFIHDLVRANQATPCTTRGRPALQPTA